MVVFAEDLVRTYVGKPWTGCLSLSEFIWALLSCFMELCYPDVLCLLYILLLIPLPWIPQVLRRRIELMDTSNIELSILRTNSHPPLSLCLGYNEASICLSVLHSILSGLTFILLQLPLCKWPQNKTPEALGKDSLPSFRVIASGGCQCVGRANTGV